MVPSVLIGHVSGIMSTLFKVYDACIVLIHFYHFSCFYLLSTSILSIPLSSMEKKEGDNRLKTEEEKEKEKKKEER